MALRGAAKMRARKNIYYSTAEVAGMLGKSTRAARSWLRSEGALMKRGGRYCTTEERLMVAFPEAFQSLAR